MDETTSIKNWHSILWQEWYHCQDHVYANQLHLLLEETFKPLRLPNRPATSEVEAALAEACRLLPEETRTWRQMLRRLETQKQSPLPVERLIRSLGQRRHWTRRFVARHTLAAVGGEAVDALLEVASNEEDELNPIAIWILENIERDTAQRYAGLADDLLCAGCLVCLEERSASWGLWRSSITYYGCRKCGQSRRLIEPPTQVVAVLDTTWRKARAEVAGCLRVNALQEDPLIEFDRVEIIRADDRQVEGFLITLGNDNDSRRQAHYRRAGCIIAPDAALSENTVRLLERQFSRVGPAPAGQ
jgi:hypothetical protein